MLPYMHKWGKNHAINCIHSINDVVIVVSRMKNILQSHDMHVMMSLLFSSCMLHMHSIASDYNIRVIEQY